MADYLYNYRTGRDGAITVKPSVRQFDIIKVRKIVEQLLQKHNAPAMLQFNFDDWMLWSHIWMYQHLPTKYKKEALQRIAQLPKNIADKVLENLGILQGEIFICGLPLLSFKRVKSRLDIFLWKLPIVTLRRKVK